MRIDWCEEGNGRNVSPGALIDSQPAKHADGKKECLNLQLLIFARFITKHMYFPVFFSLSQKMPLYKYDPRQFWGKVELFLSLP